MLSRHPRRRVRRDPFLPIGSKVRRCVVLIAIDSRHRWVSIQCVLLCLLKFSLLFCHRWSVNRYCRASFAQFSTRRQSMFVPARVVWPTTELLFLNQVLKLFIQHFRVGHRLGNEPAIVASSLRLERRAPALLSLFPLFDLICSTN